MATRSTLVRSVFTAVVCATVMVTATPTGPAARAASPSYGDATSFQINSAHTGQASGAALPSSMTKAWSRNFHDLVSYPVITGGRLFVTVGHRDLYSVPTQTDYGSSLYAFDAKTGVKLWGPIDLGGVYFWGALTYDQGKVIALNQDGDLRAFDPASGKLLWTNHLSGGAGQPWSAPVGYEGTIYIVGDGKLWAVATSTGGLRRQRPLTGGGGGMPAVNATGAYINYVCHQATAFTLSGSLMWNHNTHCAGAPIPVPVVDGKQLWLRDPNGGTADYPPAVVSIGTGRTLRNFASDTIPVFSGSQAFLIKDRVLTAVDAKTGKKLWSTTADGHLTMAPVVSGNRLYVGTGLGQVFGYDIATGKRMWRSTAGSAVIEQLEDGISPNIYAPQAMSIGGGVLVVPASTRITVFR